MLDEYMSDFFSSKRVKGIRPTLLVKQTGVSIDHAVDFLEKMVGKGRLVRSEEYGCPRCSHNLIVSYIDGLPVLAECGCCDYYAEDVEEIEMCKNRYPVYYKAENF